MKHKKRFLLALGLFLQASARAELPNPYAATVRVDFDRNRIIRTRAEGFADFDSKRPVTADDPVRIASISKLIVMLGVEALVREGKLDLSNDVSTYLGWPLRNPNFPDAVISLNMLLSHQSSLLDDAEYIIPMNDTVRQRVADPRAWNKAHAPGTWFQYTNLNFPVIASVMEAASGERFDQLMDRLVFKRYKIDGCFNWSMCSDSVIKHAVVLRGNTGNVRRDDLKGIRPTCLVYPATDGSCDLSRYRPGDNGGMFSPQGGVRISMRGLARLGQLFFARHKWLLAAEIKAGLQKQSPYMTEGQSEKGFYCRLSHSVHIIGASTNLGCNDDLFGDGRVRIGHAGEAYGLRSGLWVDIRTGKGVAFFSTAVPDDEPSGKSAFTRREEGVVRQK